MKRLNESWAIIIAAIIGLIGVIGAALITRQPTPSPTSVFTSSPATILAIDVAQTTLTPVATAATQPSPTIILSTNMSTSGATIERSPDVIAICRSDVTAKIEIGSNESYLLIDYFSAVPLGAGNCVCLKRIANPLYPMPSSCNSNNTTTVAGGDWRNQNITLSINAQPVVSCSAQSDQRQPFMCP